MCSNLDSAILEAQNQYDSAKTIIEYKEVEKKVKEIYKHYQDSEAVANLYLKILSTLCWKQEPSEWGESAEEAKCVYEKYSTSENIAKEYFNFLVNLCSKQTGDKELAQIAKEGKRVYKQIDSSESISEEYINFLMELSWKQRTATGLKETAVEAKRIYSKCSSSERVARKYLTILGNLSWKHRKGTARKKTVDEAKRVYNQHIISENISIEYIRILVVVSYISIKEYPLEEIAEDLKEVYDLFQYSKNVASEYLSILLRLVKKQEEANKIKKTAEIISEILEVHDQLIYKVDDDIDSWMFSDNLMNNDTKKIVNYLMNITAPFETKNLFSKSKYGILFNSRKSLKKEEMKILIEIFYLVQKIKNQLIVRYPSLLKFGHYTSGKVMQMLLKQKDKDKYAIVGKSRLSNVNYMNDPSEGKVLNQILQLDSSFQQLSLKPSPWFLLSLTTSIDKLSMWSQYGDRAEGVCLVLNACDFSSVNFPSDMEWLTLKKSSLMSNEDLSNVVSRRNIESKDFLYRIGYLSMQSETEISLRSEFNKCFNETEIEKINNLLQDLKGIVKVIGQESNLYEKVDECLEEIRYLFKSADYSYESELRVLKYMPLEPDNKKIKIDNSGEVAKLYIERANPIKLSEVIFGPKFSHPENVTPLLHLLDKNIKFSQSKIPFK